MQPDVAGSDGGTVDADARLGDRVVALQDRRVTRCATHLVISRGKDPIFTARF